MDILLLCGYFEPKYQKEIAEKTKTWVENAANTFQQRLIAGLKEQEIKLTIVSAPFIGPWPTVYTDFIFQGFEGNGSREGITYVSFNNIWGYRNISRTAALKKKVKAFVKGAVGEKKVVIVYSPHTPFLEAAVYAKRLDSSVHIHMVVPDLPQYMNLSRKNHPVYDLFKRIDIDKFYRLNKQVDSYMLLTKYMAAALQVGKRPYIVVEGIADEVGMPKKQHVRGKTIAYAGKLEESFGVKRLLEAFMMLEDPDARLEICGGGELRYFVTDCCSKDKRILYHGLVTAEESRRILQAADVLVNPRQNEGEYTKYSFPSKNIDYLLTGNTVVAYMLEGMPEVYRDFLLIPRGNTVAELSDTLLSAINQDARQDSMRYKHALDYIRTDLSLEVVGAKVYTLIQGNEENNDKIQSAK